MSEARKRDEKNIQGRYKEKKGRENKEDSRLNNSRLPEKEK